MRYEFWVIRYVPDPIRGEFANIGVIAGRDDEWCVRRVSNLRRASRLGGSASATATFLTRVESTIDSRLDRVVTIVETDNRPFGRGEIEDLRVRMNNVVQLSEARTVLADSAEEAAEMAFELMVVDVDYEVRHRSRTIIVRELREAFSLRPELVRHVASFQSATVGEQSGRVDFAVRNGEVRQLSQVWGFDIKNTRSLQVQVQAWNYLMGLLRQESGQLEPRGKSRRAPALLIPKDVDINAVYTTPRTTEANKQLRIALDGWKRLNIRPVESSQASSIVDRAQTLVSD
jgi:hypothetical protein